MPTNPAFSLIMVGLSLVAFFLGLRLMQNLALASPHLLERLLLRATSTPGRGLLTGALLTAAVHSSSAVTITTVALVTSGLLPLENALGVVLGSNIGTCTTVQFSAFDLTRLGWPLALAGAALALVLRRRMRFLALAAAGLGFILTALALLAKALVPLAQEPFFYSLLSSCTKSHLYAFLAGACATAVIQSSTLFTAAVIALINQAAFPLPTAIAFILGSNIGTCSDTLVAAIWGNSAGRRVAFAHLLLNVVGAAAALPLLQPFADLLALTSASPAKQVANAHLLFNLVTSLAALPFTPAFARWLRHFPRQSR